MKTTHSALLTRLAGNTDRAEDAREELKQHEGRGGDPQTIVLVVGEITTAEWYALHDKQPYPGQKYRAWLEDGTYVLEASWQPFCDGARELLAMGFDPKSALVIKRQGSEASSLSGILCEVAKLSVHEGKQGTRFAPYVPFDRERAFPFRGLGKETLKSLGATEQRTTTRPL